MINTIELTKSLPQARWGEFFDMFTNGNRGRHISIESIDPEFGNLELIKDAPLLSMIYDRPGKGNDLMIEVGKDEVSYTHTIDSPSEVMTGQNSIGEMVVVWISDASGIKTVIQLQIPRSVSHEPLI
jgi:Family of unknown function (DUF5335)